jgi:hypothetical protein
MMMHKTRCFMLEICQSQARGCASLTKPHSDWRCLSIYAQHIRDLHGFLHIIMLVDAHGIDPQSADLRALQASAQEEVEVLRDGIGNIVQY